MILKRLKIQNLYFILALGVILLVSGSISGCYAAISCKVVDTVTKEPVEGAIVFVEWTVTKGFGLTRTETYKVVEAVTDQDGEATISGVLNPLVNPPRVIVYKKGYVAWRNDYIFPDYEKRKSFHLTSDFLIEMEEFKKEYSHKEHLDFIDYGVHLYKADERKLYDSILWEKSISDEKSLRLKNE